MQPHSRRSGQFSSITVSGHWWRQRSACWDTNTSSAFICLTSGQGNLLTSNTNLFSYGKWNEIKWRNLLSPQRASARREEWGPWQARDHETKGSLGFMPQWCLGAWKSPWPEGRGLPDAESLLHFLKANLCRICAYAVRFFQNCCV